MSLGRVGMILLVMMAVLACWSHTSATDCVSQTDRNVWLRKEVERRWNQFRAVHQLKPIVVVGADNKDSKYAEIEKAAKDLAMGVCDGSVKEIKTNNLAYRLEDTSAKDRINVGFELINAIYCGNDPAYQRMTGSAPPNPMGGDEWSRVLLLQDPTEVAVAVARQELKDGSVVSYFAVARPAKKLTALTKWEMEQHSRIRKHISMQCGITNAMSTQLENPGKDASEYCQEFKPEEDAKFQREFRDRWNAYLKIHGQTEIIMASPLDDTKGTNQDVAQLAANSAHAACYHFMLEWNEELLDDRVPAFGLLKKTAETRAHLLYRRDRIEPQISGKEFADAIYCGNKEFNLRLPDASVDGAFVPQVFQMDWEELIWPSEDAAANVLGLHRTWRTFTWEGKILRNQHYAINRPTPVPFLKSEADQHGEIRAVILKKCGRTAEIDEVLKHSGSLPKPPARIPPTPVPQAVDEDKLPVKGVEGEGETLQKMKEAVKQCAGQVQKKHYSEETNEDAAKAVLVGIHANFGCKAWDTLKKTVKSWSMASSKGRRLKRMDPKWITDCMKESLQKIVDTETFNELFLSNPDGDTETVLEELIRGIRCSTGEVALAEADGFMELRKLGSFWFYVLKRALDRFLPFMRCMGSAFAKGKVNPAVAMGCKNDATKAYRFEMALCLDKLHSSGHARWQAYSAELNREDADKKPRRLHSLLCRVARHIRWERCTEFCMFLIAWILSTGVGAGVGTAIPGFGTAFGALAGAMAPVAIVVVIGVPYAFYHEAKKASKTTEYY